MRGMGQIDAIESVTLRHVEGNEGEKNGVKRGNRAFFGGKLLKRQGRNRFRIGIVPEREFTVWRVQLVENRETCGTRYLLRREQVTGEDIGGRLIELDIETLGSEGNGSFTMARGLHIFHQDAVSRNAGGGLGRRGERVLVGARVRAWKCVRSWDFGYCTRPKRQEFFISIQTASDWLHGRFHEPGARWQSLPR